MAIEISLEDKFVQLVTRLGRVYRILYNIYEESDEQTKRRIIKTMGESFQEPLERALDSIRMGRSPEGIARGMMLGEDLIGCEPKGELFSVSPDEAIRKVTYCPWADSFSKDGGTCRLLWLALEEGIGKKHGVEMFCEQNITEGAQYCIWKVRKKKDRV